MTTGILEALLNDKSLSLDFFRSAGPGGQHVNKVSTAVRLRFDVAASPLLSEAAKVRLTRIAGRRLTEDGVLLIEAQRFRTQERNRDDAVGRLVSLIRTALEKPKERIPTQPTATSQRRRFEAKRRRGALKRARVISITE